MAQVRCNNQIQSLPCVVAEASHTALCGRAWIEAFKLVDFADNCVEEVTEAPENAKVRLEALLAEFADLFEPTLGTLTDYEAQIYVRKDAEFRVWKPRPVPFALRPKIEAELNRLVAAGVLEPVDTAPFGAVPIEPAIKPSGAVRICADFKVGLNRYIDMQHYPLPVVDDILATLAGGTVFSKIDLADAYLQVRLAPAARDYVTISTHKGLFRFQRLPFGFSGAVGIFQSAIEDVTKKLPGTCAYLDDLLVMGKSDEAHLDSLRQLFMRLRSRGLRLKRDKCSFMAPSVD